MGSSKKVARDRIGDPNLDLRIISGSVKLLERLEGKFNYAYPDPLSFLGRSLSAEEIKGVGEGHYALPPDLLKFSGDPWTIGIGHTDKSLRYGSFWTDAQIISAAERDVKLVLSCARLAWPGMHLLSVDAQIALVSLGFNRGLSMKDPPNDPDWRREMRELKVAIAAGDYAGIAGLIYSMKRLWPGSKGMGNRRRIESELVLGKRR